jgi:hypothetical protein
MHIFLSHAAEDARVASALKQMIERCSFGRATVWFSSDTSPMGGVVPGGPWFDQLVERVNACSEFLALLTSVSVTNPWLHYEAGCAAMRKIPIVPIVAGISVTDVRPPLCLYNVYNVAQPEGLKTLAMRLYQMHSIPHDEAMLETPVQHAVQEINSALQSNEDSTNLLKSDGTDKLLRLIDRRFIDLINLLPVRADGDPQTPTFSVSATVTKSGKRLARISVDVSDEDSLQNVANAIYFKIQNYVEAYKYLEQWVVRDHTLGVNLIMRDFLEHVKAKAIIQPGHEYEIIILSHPYDASKGTNQTLS